MDLSVSCKISKEEYAKIIFSLILADKWVFLVFPLLLCVSLSALDVRIFIASLMVLFIAFPMAVALVYFYYMLTKSMVWSVADKTISQSDEGGIILNFENSKIHSLCIEKDVVQRAFIYHGCSLLKVEGGRYRYLAIPEAAFTGVCD